MIRWRSVLLLVPGMRMERMYYKRNGREGREGKGREGKVVIDEFVCRRPGGGGGGLEKYGPS